MFLLVLVGPAAASPAVPVVAPAPADRYFDGQYGLRQMGFPLAWASAGNGSREVLVAVLDTGIVRDHPDLDPSRILPGYDEVGDDTEPEDTCGHGTHVAGILGATMGNGEGVAGAAQVRLLPIQVIGPRGEEKCGGDHAAVARGVHRAVDAGAHVILMSLGTKTSSTALRTAVEHAASEGVVLVAAVGNSGRECEDDDCVKFPGAYPEVIAVAAVDAAGERVGSSGRGPEVEFSAPGRRIVSTDLDGGYRRASGTSMAAPHVAGAFALALSCRPDLSAADLRTVFQDTAEDLGEPGRDHAFGYGLVRIDRVIDEIGPCGTKSALSGARSHVAVVSGAGPLAFAESSDERGSGREGVPVALWTAAVPFLVALAGMLLFGRMRR
ncbi:MAG: S8 family serine peptidase [Euryarchaeota archaeon]|nr:S8 family serine peptidase [Euryarchaeota archaeon]